MLTRFDSLIDDQIVFYIDGVPHRRLDKNRAKIIGGPKMGRVRLVNGSQLVTVGYGSQIKGNK